MDHAQHLQHLAQAVPPGFDVVGALLLGILGSVHCVGMCGPLVAIQARRPDAASAFTLHQLGRIVAYAAVGLALGVAGAALHPVLAGIAAAAAGAIVVLVGLGFAGRSVGPTALVARITRPVAALSRTLAAHARRGGPGASFAMGAVHATFPCPLLVVAWGSAMALADPLRGTLGMLAFGVGTVPALAVTAAAASRIPLGRVGVQRLAGIGIAAWGSVLVAVGVSRLALA